MEPARRGAVVLRWLERLLLAAGLSLAAWSGLVLIEARHVANMPPPAPSKTLPGESVDDGGAAHGGLRPAAGEWVGRLDAASVGLAATILEGSDEATLRRGAGHIEYTPLPGQSGNSGIAGHRDTTFRPVRHLKGGDVLTLTTMDEELRYRVVRTMVVDPADVHVLDPTPRHTLTLVTCFPFDFIGPAPRRFIVQAELIDRLPR
jgi:sortase A